MTIRSFFSRVTLVVFLALLTTTTAWAQVTISTADEWNTFASNVNSGTTYSGQTVTLTADITITTGAGSSSTNSFKGTFEGGGHTLTLNLTHSSGGDAWIAPFRYINGATIKHLHTAGTITTNGKMAGGIVGDSYGTSTIQSCRSSVTISSSINGDGTHGGLVGRVNDGTLTINDCLFDGSITGSNTHSCGGFVGWKEASLVLNRCLQAGDLSGISSSGGATFSRYNSGSVDFTTCYYRTAYGTAQGTQTAATGSDLQAILGSAWEVSGDDVLPIMDTRNLTTATISGVNAYYISTGNEIKPEPTVTALDGTVLTKDTHYSVTWSGDGITEGDYTLTVTGLSPYYGTQEVAYTVVSASGNLGGYDFTVGVDADGSYYVVDGTAALNALAAYVNASNDASGMRFKQTADIDMQGESYTPIGNDEGTHMFRGTYDGDGYVIKNVSHSISGTNELSGLFGDLYGTVKNVNLKDCNFTAYRVGGIAAETHQGCLIQNCNVLGGTITGTDNYPQDTHGSYMGGIVGYNYQPTVENCFTTATFGGNAYHKGPVVSRGSSGTVTDCYYVNTPGGNTIGTQVTVYTITLGDGITMTANFRTVGKTAANTYHFGKENDEVTLTATPVEGKTAQYSVNGTPIAGNTFTMPAGDVTVSVEYVMTWTDLKTALEAGGTRTVTLTNNVTRDVVGGIFVTGTVTLDLNGYTLDGNSPTCYNPFFFLNDGVSLTITDSRTGGNLCKAWKNPTIRVNEGGSLTLAAGTINAEAVGVSVYGTFNMTGGIITGATGEGVNLGDNATFNMTGGSITGNAVGVDVNSANATFTISGNVNITGNTKNSITKNVCLNYYGDHFNPIRIGGALHEDARIGVYTDLTDTYISSDQTLTFTAGLKGKGTRENFVRNNVGNNSLFMANLENGEMAFSRPFTLVVPDNVLVNELTNQTSPNYNVGCGDRITLHFDGGVQDNMSAHYKVNNGNGTITYLGNVDAQGRDIAFTMPGANTTITKDDNDKDYTFGGITLKETFSGNVSQGLDATFDGSSQVTVSIPNEITVKSVTYNRTFTTGKCATIMLPFSMDVSNISGTNFYTFGGVEKNSSDKWIATMNQVTGTLAANTPYLVEPTATTLTFTGGATLNTTGGGNQQTADLGSNWTFKGTYAYREWIADGTNSEEIGKAYGFAGVQKTGIEIGDFVRVASGAKIRPMGCYLLWSDTPNAAPARRMTRGATVDELPSRITVRLVGSNGETTGIGEIDTRTGEITFDADSWYTLDGVRLNGKPVQSGIYINNGKQVSIKYGE